MDVSAFGKKGPYAHLRGYDLLFQSLSGLLRKRHTPGGIPMSSGIWVADASTPMAVSYGVAVALLARHRTGRGQQVEVSLLHMALAMQSVDMVRVEHETSPQEASADFSAQAIFSPYRCLDGTRLILVVLNDAQFAGLCRALDLEHLIDDPDYSTYEKRARHSHELYELIGSIPSTRDRAEWLAILERHDVPTAPVLEREEVFDHPQITANDMFVRQEHPEAGQVEMFNIPVRLSETPGSIRRPAPMLGQHTEEVLEELGYNATRIQQLREQKGDRVELPGAEYQAHEPFKIKDQSPHVQRQIATVSLTPALSHRLTEAGKM